MRRYVLLIIVTIVLVGTIFYLKSNIPIRESHTEKKSYNVQITLIDEFSGDVITGNTIEIYYLNPDGSVKSEVVARSITDQDGVAEFNLKKGVYRAKASGSFTGDTSFSLYEDYQTLRTNLRVSSIFN